MSRKRDTYGTYSAQMQFTQHAYQNSLPIPQTIDTATRDHITLQVRQTNQFLGLYDSFGNIIETTVWGYGTGQTVTYPGPTILAYENHPVTVTWQNKLPKTGHILPVDTSINIADSNTHPLSSGFVPIVTHLHGGHNDSKYDGLPDQWFTQNGGRGSTGPRDVGAMFETSTSVYQNDQHSATLWYHDHALGITRLNVYAGLAGFYILQDQERANLVSAGVLPSGANDVGVAIQDRAFTSTGQLYYPAYQNDILPGQFNDDGTQMRVKDVVPQEFYDAHGANAPSVVPEFFGDTILVNGMAWPNQDVAAGTQELRLLNGSDSRFYVLKLDDPNVKVTLVGTDGGLLPHAVTIMDGDGVQEDDEFLVLAPGDRTDLVFDFSNVHLDPGEATHAVHLQNVGPAYSPFQGLNDDGSLAGDGRAATASDPIGNIMQFTVDARLVAGHATVTDGTVLSSNFHDLAVDSDHDGIADGATQVRKVGLFEQADEYGRTMPLLGTAEEGAVRTSRTELHAGETFGPLAYDAPVTETPALFSTEDWQVFNFTADSHPIHLHLVQYQVVEKRHIDFQDANDDGVPDDTNHDGVITYGHDSVPDYNSADIWIGDPMALRPEESGWQDTVEVDPHQMMSIVATFDKPGEYVWHCHILSHEDNEMMRPFTVNDPLLA
ncbi:multicopper oxidase type 2 [Methylobacterium sp. 4-46]|uniref:multicopper oxidase family protein n=1 Tax=unclassified Methylobacterium TaxID=2615210 RepID=UPI000165CAA7|nr:MULTISPECIES: multicopper oxidase domain-containing protein [Methylobacterium]ACA16413.1 multicopper oxidase type 2 [Methylobacterium sp. 4-46]WFT82124.1 multicopper oxidase domain-containing protein [Methylobacterium nodulans]